MEKVIDLLDTSCRTLSILFAINILISSDTVMMVESLFNRRAINYNISVSAGNIISIVLILFLANFIVNMLMKNAFSKEIGNRKIIGFIVGAFLIAVFLLIAWLGRSTLFSINIFVACIATIILYVSHKLLDSIY